MSAWSQRAKTRLFAYLNGVETDITDKALVGNRGGIASFRGRQTLLSQMEPSTLQLVLNNVDGRFTPDNTSSPYYPYWGQGTRIRWTETIGPRTYTHFDGRLEIPQGSFNFMTSDASINDQIITLSAVDTLTWLGRQRPFVSTLAAHIVGSARNGALVAYWPFLDVGGARFADHFGRFPATFQLLTGSFQVQGKPFATPGAGAVIPGDQAATMRLDPAYDASATQWWSPAVSAGLTTTGGSYPIQWSAGQVATVVIWVNLESSSNQSNIIDFGTTDGSTTLAANSSVTSGTWRVSKPVGTLTGNAATTKQAPTGRWSIVALRIGYTPNLIEVWVDDETATGTLSGSLAGPVGVATIQASLDKAGSIAHMQLYVGAATDFTNADFLAQRQVGLAGLERQSTGERIRTVLGYAGVPTSAMDHIDPGSSLMSMAQLAGKTPLDAVQEANTTEQGRLFSRGDGLIAFHDRHRIYDV